jgi:hypothetical protein
VPTGSMLFPARTRLKSHPDDGFTIGTDVFVIEAVRQRRQIALTRIDGKAQKRVMSDPRDPDHGGNMGGTKL